MSEQMVLRAKNGQVALFRDKCVREKDAKTWIAAAADARAPESVKEIAQWLSQLTAREGVCALDKEERAAQWEDDIRQTVANSWSRSWGGWRANLDDESIHKEIAAGATSAYPRWAGVSDKERADWLKKTTTEAQESTKDRVAKRGRRMMLGARFAAEWESDPQGNRGLDAPDARAIEADVNRWLAIAEKAPAARIAAQKAGLEVAPLRVLTATEMADWREMSPKWERVIPMDDMDAGSSLFVLAASQDKHKKGLLFISPNKTPMPDMGGAKLFSDRASAEAWGAANLQYFSAWGVVEIKAQFVGFKPKKGAGCEWAEPFARLTAKKESEQLLAEVSAAGEKKPAATAAEAGPTRKPKRASSRL